MRIKVKAKNFQEGMVAFLPYYGKLRKAVIVGLSDPTPTKTGYKRSVIYRLVVGHDDMEQMCIMNENSVYEVWVRKPR